MKLYDFPFAPNPRKVRIYLAEKGLSVPLVPVNLVKGEQHAPEFLAKNPLGALPVLELDDGTILTESLAIIHYFEELHPEPAMIGTTPLERARVRRLEQIAYGSVLGPIVGPVLGGYLSEAYSWRWVFYMIVPFALFALAGTWLYIRDRERRHPVRLDWTGFLLLAAALASLQLMLDRGERADWFDSAEIVAWAVAAGLALYLFLAHTFTRERPFLEPALFRDRNFWVGIVLVFVFGMLNFTPMTLLPPLLQGVSGYPDSVIGFVLGARGTGTLLAFALMIVASRLDPRWMIGLGFVLQAVAGWQLASLDPNLGTADVFWPMALQGFGVGILWVPITQVTFSTLRGEFLAEGTAIFHMLRNIGSSIHISLSITLVVRMTQAHRAEISPAVTPFNEALSLPGVVGAWDLGDPRSLASLHAEIGRQASMLGYIDAFWAFAAAAVVVLPLIALVRWKP